LDTEGNIFGGFTPVEWEDCRPDNSLKSFLFTVKNPHNLPARRFPLKATEKAQAIFCAEGTGASFSFEDLSVSEKSDENTESTTCSVGVVYLKDTELKGERVFMGSEHFQVKEIEVFQLTDFNPLVPPQPARPFRSLNSVIISEFPEIFTEFRGKWFSLLWRGSREGFGAIDFHHRCDGHENTLTLVLDMEGNIFGGFTPVEWESRVYDESVYGYNCYKADDSLKSFLFTLVNQHAIPPRKFPLLEEKKEEAIMCDSNLGPSFSWADLRISGGCHISYTSLSCLGVAYTNDTDVQQSLVLAGGSKFMVKEIEVFEIRD
jgi:hypothetical protein